jgi:FkbM family methyltransferase
LASDDCEPRATALFTRVVTDLPKESIFFDIGANIGKYTWLAASLRSDLIIHSFEPDLSNFELLQKTKLGCSNKNIHLHCMAISDADGSAAFAVDHVTGATGTLETDENFTARHYRSKSEKVEVKVSRLSTVVDHFGSPWLIKIDVEGHETSVFDGAGGLLLSSNPPLIMFECFEHPLPFQFKFDEANYCLFDADNGGTANESTTNYWAIQQCSQLLSIFT